MVHQNSILSQDPAFYSAYEYEEDEKDGSGTQNVFMKVLLKLLFVLSILLAIYFAFNYISKMDIDFKKLNFWSIEKQSNSSTREMSMEVVSQKMHLKKLEIEPTIQKIIKNLHKEEVVEVSKIELAPINKSIKETSHEHIKNPSLVKEYLDAIRKELGKN